MSAPAPAISKSAPISKFSRWIYAILWLIGAASAVLGFYAVARPLLKPEEYGRLFDSVFIIWIGFGVGSFFHLGFIYRDIHRMEHRPELFQTPYPTFFGTKTELLLRILAFILLITVAGKFIPVLDIFSMGEQKRHEVLVEALVWGNTGLFFVLLVWDCLAWRDHKNNYKKIHLPTLAYLVSDLIALVCWFTISESVENNHMSPGVSLLIIMIILLYGMLMAGRAIVFLILPWWRERKNHLVKSALPTTP